MDDDVDDERLHISLEECQDRLKTWLLLQYGILEAVSTKMPIFQCCLKLSGCFVSIGILYSSLRVGSNL